MLNVFPYRVLYVDLSSHKIWDEEISREDIVKYAGSRGINAKLLWDLTDENTLPLDENNPLIFGAGTFTGTHAPSSGRTTVTCISPTTGLYLKSSTGGHWGSELKYAGYSNLVVLGKSKKPVYICINDETVEIKDASHLWGKDARETVMTLKGELKDDETQVACIGPAGENLVDFGCIMFNIYCAAGRGGTGMLMGAKLLKAITVRGSKPLTLHDPKEFNRLSVTLRHDLSNDTGAQRLSVFGTAGIINTVNTGYALPSYNFQENHIEGAYKISGEKLNEENYLKRRGACGSCGIGCHRYTEVDEGKYKGTYAGGPEFETLSALGSGCAVLDMDTVLKGNELCNIYGMDTISAGSVIQWAMECAQRGLLTSDDTDGLDLVFGNGDAMIEMLTKIAYRDGFGNILADGVKKASEKVGGESWKWAVQAKGLEQSRVEIRLRKGYSLAFAVNPRGPDHLMTECVAESARTPEGKELIRKICGDEKYASPYLTEKRADIVRWHEDCYAVTDSLGICAFATTLAYAIGPKEMAELFESATGIPMTEEQIMEAGRRTVTLEKVINVRRGADRSMDILPWRIMNEPIKSGPMKGSMITKEILDKMLDEYYKMHGWDKRTSWPKAEILEYLGLRSVASELKGLGRLP
jgi:aldehyde:ferredoxin oxidoreductase